MNDTDAMTTAPSTAPSPPQSTPATKSVGPRLVLTVTNFKPIGSGTVAHTMTAPNPPPNVSLNPNGTRLHVRAPGATLPFTIEPAEYRPVGITFRQGNAPVLVDGSGSPFRHMRLDPGVNAIEIEDTFAPPPRGAKPVPKRYKFSVLVQRVRDNVVGVIDPDVENEN
jgi:hypothetical protein